MKYDATAASGKKIRTLKFSAWNRNSKVYEKKQKTLLTVPAELSQRKKMTFAFWDLEKCFVDRIYCTGL